MTLATTAFIVNPHAGNRSTGSKWPEIRAHAKNRLGNFTTYVTETAGDAERFAKQAISDGARRLVCVGGDGTLNEVVNGIMAHDESIRTGLRLGFVPNGTGCDFVRTVPIPTNINQALDLIAEGPVQRIDLGKLCFKDHKGRACFRYFHNIASFGVGGEVDERVNRSAKTFGPFFSFIWATLLSIILYGKKRVVFSVDDGYAQEQMVWNMVVANGQYHGGGMWVAPNASVADNLFNVTVIGDLTLLEVFLNLPRLYNGKISEIDKVLTMTGKKVEAFSNRRVLLDVDGEQPGMLPVVITMMPDALNLIAAG